MVTSAVAPVASVAPGALVLLDGGDAGLGHRGGVRGGRRFGCGSGLGRRRRCVEGRGRNEGSARRRDGRGGEGRRWGRPRPAAAGRRGDRAQRRFAARDAVGGAGVHAAAVSQDERRDDRDGQAEDDHRATLSWRGREASTRDAESSPQWGVRRPGQGSPPAQSARVSASSRPAESEHARRSHAA